MKSNINTVEISKQVLTQEDINVVAALVYVLGHLKPFDSVAQATSQATGVKYARCIATAIKRMKAL